MDLGFTQLKL
uniref:Uncharacterized protein n=1 Tax=Rhizophora mucronata TaxID=61149 RepID=A0A2P2PE59_RHIMU